MKRTHPQKNLPPLPHSRCGSPGPLVQFVSDLVAPQNLGLDGTWGWRIVHFRLPVTLSGPHGVHHRKTTGSDPSLGLGHGLREHADSIGQDAGWVESSPIMDLPLGGVQSVLRTLGSPLELT